MLIVAIPKSASNSSLSTIGKLYGIPVGQIFFPKKPNTNTNTNYIHKIHGNIREIDQSLVKKFNNKNILFKQHIYPSKNNINLLSGLKKIILLRKPEDIVYSYRRSNRIGYNEFPQPFSSKQSQRELEK